VRWGAGRDSTDCLEGATLIVERVVASEPIRSGRTSCPSAPRPFRRRPTSPNRSAPKGRRGVVRAGLGSISDQKYGFGMIFTSIGAPYHFSQVSLTKFAECMP
jgi:hypothetical protein